MFFKVCILVCHHLNLKLLLGKDHLKSILENNNNNKNKNNSNNEYKNNNKNKNSSNKNNKNKNNSNKGIQARSGSRGVF